MFASRLHQVRDRAAGSSCDLRREWWVPTSKRPTARYTARWQPVLPLTESRAEGKLQGQLLLLSQADHVTDVAENPTGNLSTTKISPRPRHMEYLRKSTSTNGDNEEKKWRNLRDTTKLVEQSKQALKTRTQFPYPQATSPSPASHCKPFLNWALPR